MALWLIRAGKHGQHELKFLADSCIYLCWDGLHHDLAPMKSRDEIADVLREVYPNNSEGRIKHHSRQIWTFVKRMNAGDWVVVPSKLNPVIHVAEITGDYVHVPDAENPYYHYHEVKWVEKDIRIND